MTNIDTPPKVRGDLYGPALDAGCNPIEALIAAEAAEQRIADLIEDGRSDEVEPYKQKVLEDLAAFQKERLEKEQKRAESQTKRDNVVQFRKVGVDLAVGTMTVVIGTVILVGIHILH